MALRRNVYCHGEANWGRPLASEMPGGSHLTFEVPLRWRDRVVALLLDVGIHGADRTKLYFPHDLIRVGETVPDAVGRIVRDACGAEVARVAPGGLEAWTGEQDHWHVCYTAVATIRRLPRPGGNVREVIAFRRDEIPRTPFAWWTRKDLRALFES